MSNMMDFLTNPNLTPQELWDMREDLIHYIETLEGQNDTLAGILDDLQGGE